MRYRLNRMQPMPHADGRVGPAGCCDVENFFEDFFENFSSGKQNRGASLRRGRYSV